MAKDRLLTSRSQGPPLPLGGGPRLDPFEGSGETIKWLKRLDTDREGNEGFVFQVLIGFQEYALKVFKFSHPRLNRYYRDLCLKYNTLPLNEAIWYTDPFYAECRAYGKIQEGFDTRVVTEQTAVKCYGYLLLSRNDTRLENEGIDLDHELLDPELREALGGDIRVRAIVKHFEKNPATLHAGNIRRAWRSVYLLNSRLKIYNMDVKADNFIGYRLVDFGSENWAEANRLKDRVNFKNMIEEEEIPTRLQVMARSEHQLRSRGNPEWGDRELPKKRRIISE
ncbi:kinetochore Sim4 complex subunit FTA2-domain-containing protein [Nemania abortiva]|nr:kinetochore Sim4 complex subunit FTA2-domain-containing protein [Nemania abortiva]